MSQNSHTSEQRSCEQPIGTLHLKAGVLGKKKLPPEYRIGSPVQPSQNLSYSWEEAKNIILKAFCDFNPEFGKIAEMFFDKGWIDARYMDGKSPRAFTYPAIADHKKMAVNPMILVNFNGKLDHVISLAHELGHGIFEYLAAGQGTAGHMPIPLPWEETISFLAETMVFDQLLKDLDTREYVDKNEKIKIKQYLMFTQMQRTMNKIMDQVCVYRFEQAFHNHFCDKGEFSVNDLSEMWLEETQKKNGAAAPPVGDYDHSFAACLPCTNEAFGAIAYPFGALLALGLWEYRKKPDFAEKFLNLLRKGGDICVEDFQELFGWDLQHVQFWNDMLGKVSDKVHEVETLCRPTYPGLNKSANPA